MPTDPLKINVERIIHVSDDENSTGKNELMTAAATQRMMMTARGTMPLVRSFTAADLAAGILTTSYITTEKAVYVVVVDNEGNEVKSPVNYDQSTGVVTINFSTIIPFTGTWTVSIWTPTGPKQAYPADVNVGAYAASLDFFRKRVAEGILIDFKGGTTYLVYDVPLGYAFVIEDLNFGEVESDGVLTSPEVTLQLAGPVTDVLVNSQPVPLNGTTTKHYNFNLRSLTNGVLPATTRIFLTVTVEGTATGDYTAKADVAGYLIPWPFFGSSSSSSSSTSSSSSSSTSSSSSSTSSSSSSTSSSSSSSSAD